MKRGPKELTGPFHKAGMALPRVPAFIDRKPCCWLAPFDPLHEPCGGGWKWEAFHFIGKVAIRRVLKDRLWVCDACEDGAVWAPVETTVPACCGQFTSTGECCGEPVPELSVDYDCQPCPACEGNGMPLATRDELIELAEWDPRNAGPGCVDHHRRFDGLANAGPGSAITVYRETLPAHVEEFIADWGLDSEAERKFPLRPLSPA